MSRNGIEPCEKPLSEETECICGLLPEGLTTLESEEASQPGCRCRLCTGLSEHYFYRASRFGQFWGLEVCGICGVICNEY